jgi:hypothetical protein
VLSWLFRFMSYAETAEHADVGFPRVPRVLR